ncbi:hypothetical protein [Formosa algae]|jgi:hypothetical protein|uniref:Uncharacterized protein n=1 Tax=Formosa algae TaxID=225843 RepID=A0A9X1C9Y8_9FLAO|nr:hypothetical protein [Formosa algae]MBP1838247.1 hypothetical protein [Formosa algae]MDQ0334382.1 hypothetical protein [Formosa algae]OEI80674.1 hypothetical protein AST99_07615 [Formosa algae]PNW29941.1 hypothetical protein BKP44_02175 [Formosa algae]
MSKKFIELELGSHIIVHGFDAQNKEISERVEAEGFTKKIVAMSRIKSISENYILTDYTAGRIVYWEYKADYESIKKELIK